MSRTIGAATRLGDLGATPNQYIFCGKCDRPRTQTKNERPQDTRDSGGVDGWTRARREGHTWPYVWSVSHAWRIRTAKGPLGYVGSVDDVYACVKMTRVH